MYVCIHTPEVSTLVGSGNEVSNLFGLHFIQITNILKVIKDILDMQMSNTLSFKNMKFRTSNLRFLASLNLTSVHRKQILRLCTPDFEI
jgi:hypothetical protein